MPFNALKIAQKLARNSSARHPVPQVSVAAGAAINTNIAITGVRRGLDELVAVLQVEPDNGASGTMLTDRTAEASVTSNGNIQLTTTNTTGKQLLVIWYHVQTP